MPGDPSTEGLTQWMERMERRLRDLETAPRQRKTGQIKGTYTVYDGDPATEAGVPRVQVGEIVHPFSNPVGEPDFGLIVRADNAAGNDNEPVFMIDSGGALIPGDKGFLQQVNNTVDQTHTSTSYTDSWQWYFIGVLGGVVSTSLQIRAGTGITAASARLTTVNLATGDVSSDAIALTADNTPIGYTWHADPGGSIDPNNVWQLKIQTKIDTGAGTMYVTAPRWAVQRSRVAVDTNVTFP